MAKHKLYRQFESTSPLTSSLDEEISPVRDVRPSTSDTVALVRYNLGKSKCADKSVTNKKSANDERVTNKKTNLTFSDPLPVEDSVHDSSSEDFYDTFPRPGLKLPYSSKEDEWILKFILKGQNVFKVGSLSLWKHLESKKENPKRTYQSLKNRFLRSIRPHIFTRYGHLITSDTEIQRILARFPELKCKVGRTNTLSRIRLPARNLNSKSAEGGLVSRSRGNDERIASPRTSTSDGLPRTSTSDGLPRTSTSARREPTLNLHDLSNFERKVTFRNKSLAVSVNFSSKEQLQDLPTPSIGIYETYKKFKKKNKLVLCSACGRYNQPKNNRLADSGGGRKSLNFNGGRQVLVTNSLDADPGISSVTNSGSPSAKRRKVGESEPCPNVTFRNPSDLKDAGKEHITPVGWGTPDGPLETHEIGRAPETTNSVGLRQEADSAVAKRLREADDDLDSTYDDTVTDFKKLIKNEEEQLLVKRCLCGKGGILGLSDSISQLSMESYFVRLSPNLETPELTFDYLTQSPTRNSERDNSSQPTDQSVSERDSSSQPTDQSVSERDSSSQPTDQSVSERGNSNSLLARNMMKMLEKSKTSKES